MAKALLEAIRPHQWVKNLTCLAGLIFSGQLFVGAMQWRAGLAVVAFSAMASAVYLLNDFLDRVRDRENPRTANRPFASGRLAPSVGLAAGLGLAALSGALSIALGIGCVVAIVAYATMNVAYSIRLKRTVIADVFCIALGFVLRVLYGVYAVQVDPSPWIVLCMFFQAFFLGLGKRRSELFLMGDGPRTARPVLTKYSVDFLDFAMGIMATLTISTYSLYCISPNHDPSLVITVLPVVYCELRYAHQVLVEGKGQSPERLLYGDKMLWLGVFAWLLLAIGVLYLQPHFLQTPAVR